MNTEAAAALADARWRKSRYSGSGGTNCVELAEADMMIAVRDSKHPAGPVLLFQRTGWETFVSRMKSLEPVAAARIPE